MTTKLSNNSETQQRIEQKKPLNGTPSDSGLLHTDNWIDEVGIQYKNAPNEKIISKNGAFVVLGTDRPDSQASGYGAKGSSRAASIDLVVGRMSSARGGNGPKEGTFVDNSFAADAARIYISQQTNIDANFGIVEGTIGNSKARSAVGIKADGIRIFGREGIKIVTGKGNNWKGFSNKGETNSLGGKISQPAPGIEFIAGNNTEPRKVRAFRSSEPEMISTLQAVALGDNTRDALLELGKHIESLISVVTSFAILQTTINTSVGTALASSGVYPPHAAASSLISGLTASRFPTSVLNPLYQSRLNKVLEFDFNYLHPFSYKYICSRSVRTT